MGTDRRFCLDSMRLSFCPFSLAVFLGTAAYVTVQKRQAKRSDKSSTSSSSASNSTSTLPPCQVVFVLGGPGAGKGTQCALLEERLKGWAHLSTGDLLRAERQKGGALGDEINQYIAKGELVPSQVTCRLLQQAMTEVYRQTGKTKFMIDGFPRSFANAQVWAETMSTHSVEFVLNLECPEEVLIGRLLHRGQTSGRADDTIDVIRKRFATNQKETAPVVERYEKEGKLLTVLSDKAVEEVYKEVSLLFVTL